MKKIAAIVLAAAVSVASLSAQEDSSYSISMDFPYVTEYVFRGVGLAEESIQPSIEFASGDLYAGVWTSQPVAGAGVANEFDFYLGYGWALNDTWAVDAGAAYYYYPELPSGSSTLEPFVGLAGDFGGGFSGSGYFYHDIDLEASTFQFDLAYSIEMSDTSTFDLGGNFGFVSADGGGDYNYYGLTATLSYTLNDVAGSYLGVAYADNDIGGGTEDGFVYLIAGLSIGF
jgi:uncharacterized protein (TIGR02001 family)